MDEKISGGWQSIMDLGLVIMNADLEFSEPLGWLYHKELILYVPGP